MISSQEKRQDKRLWVELSLLCSKILEEALSDFLISELERGVIVEEDPDNEELLVIKAYLSREDLESGALGSIEGYLEELIQLHPDATVRILGEKVVEEDWHDKWKEYFRPLRVGRRLVVKPTWEEYVPDIDDIVIEIDPGRAFGVGSHPSTRLMLKRLEELADADVLGGAEVLDVGTGSGILAIAAARLGAKTVLAIDNDLDAVETARNNVHLNNVHGKVSVSGTPVWEVEGPFDIVLANIDRDTLLLLCKELVNQVGRGGRLVLSGILQEQKDAVVEAFEGQGLGLAHSEADEKDDQWVLLEFQKRS
ncbi:MAG: 50S ribosomal protein L11 methyltransferase [Thermodesulfobacteria bacterium]|nr:50S ribosomal protein L11 methyltransferase [Thermodesulfobacteriota bacterium]